MLTPLQEAKLTRYFRMYDVDGDGRIARPDFERIAENARVLYDLDPKAPRHEALRDGYLALWDSLSASADTNRDGGVDLKEWLAYWVGVLADDARYQKEVAAVTARLFEVFDTDGDGVLGPDEFCNFYGVYGLSSAKARLVFLDMDANDDGSVTRAEFLQLAHEFYRSDDPNALGNRLFGPTN